MIVTSSSQFWLRLSTLLNKGAAEAGTGDSAEGIDAVFTNPCDTLTSYLDVTAQTVV
jgi:hypothetical protein